MGPARLRELGDRRLHATDAELTDALNGQPQPLHRKLLLLYLQRLDASLWFKSALSAKLCFIQPQLD
jgi:hypothetical protein